MSELIGKLLKWLCVHQHVKLVARFKGLKPIGYDVVCRSCDKILK